MSHACRTTVAVASTLAAALLLAWPVGIITAMSRGFAVAERSH